MADREPARLWRRTPRPWHGMTPAVWLRLLACNRAAVSPGRLPMALAISALSLGNSAAGLLQRARYGRAIAGATVGPPPLFIIGHWRTGTTLLHELLALDE
ncbi:MAG: sulfotransferase [Actinomycetota bacterium]